uniref:Uncharacterized protein n=1 Tax=Anguilla anguilla TaxID=7936 RepID=A0A0E9S546_ANGAN
MTLAVTITTTEHSFYAFELSVSRAGETEWNCLYVLQ